MRSDTAAKLRPLNVLEQKVEDGLAGIRLKFVDAGGEASRAVRFVSGWVRSTGCSEMGNLPAPR